VSSVNQFGIESQVPSGLSAAPVSAHPLRVHIPRLLGVSVDGATLQAGDPVETADIEARVKIGPLTASTLIAEFSEITLERKIRSSSSGDVLYTLPSLIFQIGNSFTGSGGGWSALNEASGTYLVYTDVLEPKHGHKNIQYTLKQKAKQGSAITASTETGNTSPAEGGNLPNHPGKITAMMLRGTDPVKAITNGSRAGGLELQRPRAGDLPLQALGR
jgi:hypothetical protein